MNTSVLAEQAVPLMYEHASGLANIYCLGDSGIREDSDVGIALFEGEFDAGAKAPEPDFSTIVMQLAGPKVYWGEADSKNLSVGRAGEISVDPSDIARRGGSTGLVRFAHFYLGNHLLSSLADELGWRSSGKVELQDVVGEPNTTLYEIATLLGRRLIVGDDLSVLERQSWGQVIALEVLRTFSSLQGRKLSRPRPGLSKNRVAQVIDFIEDNLSSKLKLESLAAVATLTPYHFARSFKEATNKSPHAFVTERRVLRAEMLITKDQMSMADIAYSVGFSSQQHLIAAFKKHTGITPGAYLKKITKA